MISKLKTSIIILMISMLMMTFYSLGKELPTAQKESISVWVRTVNIHYNNQDVTGKLTPIVVKGMTYLPIGHAANLFGRDIEWDPVTKTVTIKDRSDDSQYMAQKEKIKSLDNKIQSLKNKIRTFKLSALEDKLNDKYDEYKNVKLKFVLTGNDEVVNVEIIADKDDWEDRVSSYSEKRLIRRVCHYIQADFSAVIVKGAVKDGSEKIIAFSSRLGEAVLTRSKSINDLEDILNEKLLEDEFGSLSNISNLFLDIDIEGETEDFSYYIRIDLDGLKKAWNTLNETEIELFMSCIYNYIKDEEIFFEDAKITGYFYDTDRKEYLVKCYERNGELKCIFY